jgi:hypothetical protein
MDPNATLAILRQTIKEFRALADKTAREQPGDIFELVDLGDTIAEAAGALDDWLTKGGFKPEAWNATKVNQGQFRSD